jgi:L-amino acid N-acyltransferase YncA
MELQLRIAAAGDFDFVHRIKSEPKNIRWTGHTSAPDRGRLQAWFDQQLVSATRVIFIGEQQGEPVGYAYADESPEAIETAVAVCERHEGRGVGRALVRLVAERCRQKHPGKPLHAWILTDNFASIRIHEQAGYRRTDQRKQKPLDDDRSVEMVLFVIGAPSPGSEGLSS